MSDPIWNKTDKAAIQAEEMGGGLGLEGMDSNPYVTEDIEPPNIKAGIRNAWKWIQRKVGRGKAH